MSGRKRGSVWEDDAGVPRLVPAAEPPPEVEINGAPVRDRSHEHILRARPHPDLSPEGEGPDSIEGSAA